MYDIVLSEIKNRLCKIENSGSNFVVLDEFENQPFVNLLLALFIF